MGLFDRFKKDKRNDNKVVKKSNTSKTQKTESKKVNKPAMNNYAAMFRSQMEISGGHPSENDSLHSLVKEWEIHNNVYKSGLFQSNTADCDFNNGDEGKGYWDFFVTRVLK